MEYPKYQFSLFDGEDGQYVVRTEDETEFKQLVAKVRLAVSARHPELARSSKELTYDRVGADKSKTPYMWENDPCPVCHKGLMVKTVKVNKKKEKYNCLICEKSDCTGYAYLSKFPKLNGNNYGNN